MTTPAPPCWDCNEDIPDEPTCVHKHLCAECAFDARCRECADDAEAIRAEDGWRESA